MPAFLPLIPWAVGGVVALAAGEGVRRAGEGIEDAAEGAATSARAITTAVYGLGAFWVAKEVGVPMVKKLLK